jgi:hypothetical protein
MITNHR